jgi:hypothetical protein
VRLNKEIKRRTRVYLPAVGLDGRSQERGRGLDAPLHLGAQYQPERTGHGEAEPPSFRPGGRVVQHT